MISFLAIAVLLASCLLVLFNLRMVARDTFQTLVDAASRAHQSGVLVQRTAFATLWVMIFTLSYF